MRLLVLFATGLLTARAFGIVVPTAKPQSQAAHRDLSERPGAFSTYRNDRCGVTFSYPPSWESQTTSSNSPPGACFIRLRPTTWDITVSRSAFNDADHAISLEVLTLPLADALKARGFTFADGAWIYGEGTADRQRPLLIHDMSLVAYEVTFHSRRYLKEGTPPGTASQTTLIVAGTPSRAAALTALTPNFDTYTFYAIVRSMTFYSPLDTP